MYDLDVRVDGSIECISLVVDLISGTVWVTVVVDGNILILWLG